MLKNNLLLLKKGRRPYLILFTLAGGLGGFLYWRFVGCNTGTCPIKSVWYYSTLYGLIIGYLAGDIISGFILKKRGSGPSDK
ncbi:MAG: hypothetical protein KFF49_00560 [Bacteroidales bacterium]|nr:hypothetical protein [Bacteroidales bacterium]